jgi:hypothetical protein
MIATGAVCNYSEAGAYIEPIGFTCSQLSTYKMGIVILSPNASHV